MAWVFLLKGASVRAPERDDELEMAVTNDPEYHELEIRVEDLGLKMYASTNDDEGGVDFFLGEELLPARHVYQGQTHVCPVPEDGASDSEEFKSIVANLEGIVKRHAGGEIKVSWGIVLNQFD